MTAAADLAVLKEVTTEHGKQLDDHEDRIRAGERWRYALPATLFMSTGTFALGVAQLVLR